MTTYNYSVTVEFTDHVEHSGKTTLESAKNIATKAINEMKHKNLTGIVKIYDTVLVWAEYEVD